MLNLFKGSIGVCKENVPQQDVLHRLSGQFVIEDFLSGFTRDQVDELSVRVYNRQGIHLILGHQMFGLFYCGALFDCSHRGGHEAVNGEPGFWPAPETIRVIVGPLQPGLDFDAGGHSHDMPGTPEGLGDLVHIHVQMAAMPDELNFSAHSHGS